MTLTSRHFLHGGLVTESYNMGSGQRFQERYRPRAEGLMRRERLMLSGSWGLTIWAQHSPTGSRVSTRQ